MKFLALLLGLFVQFNVLYSEKKEDIHDFKLPSLSASSKKQAEYNSSDDSGLQLQEDKQLKIKGPLKNQLIQVDGQIELVKQMKKIQMDRAYHYQKKANVFYDADQIDQYKNYMQLYLQTQEKITQLQARLQELQVIRYNLLHRIQLDQVNKQEAK